MGGEVHNAILICIVCLLCECNFSHCGLLLPPFPSSPPPLIFLLLFLSLLFLITETLMLGGDHSLRRSMGSFFPISLLTLLLPSSYHLALFVCFSFPPPPSLGLSSRLHLLDLSHFPIDTFLVHLICIGFSTLLIPPYLVVILISFCSRVISCS